MAGADGVALSLNAQLVVQQFEAVDRAARLADKGLGTMNKQFQRLEGMQFSTLQEWIDDTRGLQDELREASNFIDVFQRKVKERGKAKIETVVTTEEKKRFTELTGLNPGLSQKVVKGKPVVGKIEGMIREVDERTSLYGGLSSTSQKIDKIDQAPEKARLALEKERIALEKERIAKIKERLGLEDRAWAENRRRNTRERSDIQGRGKVEAAAHAENEKRMENRRKKELMYAGMFDQIEKKETATRIKNEKAVEAADTARQEKKLMYTKMFEQIDDREAKAADVEKKKQGAIRAMEIDVANKNKMTAATARAKEMDDQYISTMRKKRDAGVKLSAQEEKQISQTRIMAQEGRKLSDVQKRLIGLVGKNDKQWKLYNGTLNKTESSHLRLRNEISKIRNAFLVYSFALRPIVTQLQKATDAAVQYERATVGLHRVGMKFGEESTTIEEALDSLTRDGLIKVSDAAMGLKNLLATGIGMDKALQVMNSLKDSAAFNRQGMLEYGQAVVGATDGIKNMLSRMVDNAGITKNLSNIIKEQSVILGKNVDQLTEREKHLAIANGIIKEGLIFQGDAAQLADTLGGRMDALAFAVDKAYRAFGQLLERSGAIKVFTNTVSGLAEAISDAADSLGRTAEEKEYLAAKTFGVRGKDLEFFKQQALQSRIAKLEEEARGRMTQTLIDGGKYGLGNVPGTKNSVSMASKLVLGDDFEKYSDTNFQKEFDNIRKAFSDNPNAKTAGIALDDLAMFDKELKTHMLTWGNLTNDMSQALEYYDEYHSRIELVTSTLKRYSAMQGKSADTALDLTEATKKMTDAERASNEQLRIRIERLRNRGEVDRWEEKRGGLKLQGDSILASITAKMADATDEEKKVLQSLKPEVQTALAAALSAVDVEEKLWNDKEAEKRLAKALREKAERYRALMKEFRDSIADARYLRRDTDMDRDVNKQKSDFSDILGIDFESFFKIDGKLNVLREEAFKFETLARGRSALVNKLKADKSVEQGAEFPDYMRMDELEKRISANSDILKEQTTTRDGLYGQIKEIESTRPSSKKLALFGGKENLENQFAELEENLKRIDGIKQKFFDENKGLSDKERADYEKQSRLEKLQTEKDFYSDLLKVVSENQQRLSQIENIDSTIGYKMSRDQRIALAYDEADKKFEILEDLHARGQISNQEFTDRSLALDKWLAEQKIEIQNEPLRNLVEGFSNVNKSMSDLARAASLFGTIGPNSIDRFAKRLGIATNAIGNMIDGLTIAISHASALNTLSGAAGFLGGAGLIIGGAMALTSAFGDDRKSSGSSRKSSEFGGSINRGPQTINISPSITVNAEGDVLFSQDSIEVIRDQLVKSFQEAYEFQEIQV